MNAMNLARKAAFSSNIGRFMSPDPHAGDIGDPQTLNRYAYVRNNPLTLTDPTGMDASGGDDGISIFFGECLVFCDVTGGGVGHQPPIDAPPDPGNNPNPGAGAGDPDPNGPFSGTTWPDESFGIPNGIQLPVTGNLATLLGLQTPNPFIFDNTDNSSPFNGPSYSSAQVCAASALLNRGGQAALDLLGAIPLEGTAVKVTQAVVTFASAGIAVGTQSSPGGAGIAFAGLGLWSVNTGHAILKSTSVSAAEAVPVLGWALSGFSFLNDVWGKEGLVQYYNDCMSGKN